MRERYRAVCYDIESRLFHRAHREKAWASPLCVLQINEQLDHADIRFWGLRLTDNRDFILAGCRPDDERQQP